ncbi:MAG: hypothetical protein U9R57_05390 [Thermodesulfobacteriota bacterium]|nr:hypothetical protein [Thermodesulfobacteriota bacterium]
MTEAELQENISQERTQFSKIWRAFLNRISNFLFFFYPGAVSKIHQQEATEKYWILWRDVEILYSNTIEKLKLGMPVSLFRDPKDVEGYVSEMMKEIEARHDSSGITNKNNKLSVDGKANLKLLLYFYKILINDRKKLTRREGDLNILWRDLTFIRTRMLTEGIIDCDRLPFQLDYCRAEAARLGVQESEELQAIIIDAAVDLDNRDLGNSQPDDADSASNKSNVPNQRSVRNIVRILIRLNNRRLKRLHRQRMNKIMYQAAFTILLLLSYILLHAHEHVTAFANDPQESEGQAYEQVHRENIIADKRVEKDLEPLGKQLANEAAVDNDAEKVWAVGSVFVWLKLLLLKIILLPKLCKDYMEINPLFFIFFAGLTGGFLSTVMRLGQGENDSRPGDDAYYAWYALTKPIVGALAAAILYVIFLAGFAPTEVFSTKYIDAIKANPVGAKGFAFGCIMGFSERIIMPKVR